MVLGLRSKNKKGISVQVEYTIHVHEIKPWPPTQSLRSLKAVVLHLENGDQAAKSGSQVVPSLLEQRIVFNESFNIGVTLQKELSSKGTEGGKFLKNLLDLNLYEIRREKAVRGQLLGSASVDFSEYGAISESVSVSVPVNCKRSFRNSAQPVLSLTIQQFRKVEFAESSATDGSSSLDVDSSPSVTINGEEVEEEITLFTEDDSSLVQSASAEDLHESSHSEGSRAEPSLPTSTQLNTEALLIDLPESSELEKNTMGNVETKEEVVDTTSVEGEMKEESSKNAENLPQNLPPKSVEDHDHIEENSGQREEAIIGHVRGEIEETTSENEEPKVIEVAHTDSIEIRCLTHDPNTESQCPEPPESLQAVAPQSPEEMSPQIEQADTPHVEQIGSPESQHAVFPQSRPADPDKSQQEAAPESQQTVSPQDQQVDLAQHAGNSNQRLLKSVRSSSIISRDDHSLEEVKEIHVLEKSRNRESSFSYRRKANELESKVKLLEAELREAAAVEIGLYSVVAEHGSSAQKVNAPARRLLRLYHSITEGSGSAARTSISGLILAAKACGNDVPRLTFWLSNTVVLRAVAAKRIDLSDASESSGQSPESNPLRWRSLIQREKHISSMDDLADWEDPRTFILALEKIEAWIFSRVVQSLWWQTLTPHMQSPWKFDVRRKDHSQMSFSIDLWKKAFKDASERLCPVRAGGHQCGCLPMLPKLIMEQCVARLDVAMFNAILRESGDDIPTDPVSDPITDTRVLPIPAGKLSFSAGAQLKNTIGNWCRGLPDWFGIDDEEESRKPFRLLNALSDLMMLPKDMLLDKSIRREFLRSQESIPLRPYLALDLIVDATLLSFLKVCPIFSAPILKRILSNFEPDEFCSDAVPKELLDMLDLEDQELFDIDGEVVRSFPCAASQVVYSPPDVAAVADIIGDSCPRGSILSKSSSAALRKSNTSDDELDELDSPLVNVIQSFSLTQPLIQSGSGSIRYQLLREVWRKDD